ncbi:MAG: sugar phosphate isomerase/epimerase [Candidatus Hydrogenedentes bacterium]|nr:sugar phosphate isomerase/epimerase [Candidatus Hydrogenedentota bacterium]
MKPSINQWAFPGDMPATDAISLAKKIGFSAFEVCVGEAGPTRLDATEAEITAIRKHAEAEGITLCSVGSGLGWDHPFSSTDAQVRAKALEVNQKALQITQWLGADALLVVPGSCDANTSYDVALENMLEGIRALGATAEKLKVAAAVENVWNKVLISPVEMRDFIDQCENEYVGAFVDVGNMVLFGFPEQWLRILGHRVKAVHMKDFRASAGNMDGFVMLMEGDVNWPEVMAALREIGYDRGLTAEYGPYKHSLEAMLQHVLTSIETIMSL